MAPDATKVIGVPLTVMVSPAAKLGDTELLPGAPDSSVELVTGTEAAVLATLEEFASRDVIAQSRRSSAIVEHGLVQLKELPFIAHVRGEKGGMVWGVETCDYAGKSAVEWANELVKVNTGEAVEPRRDFDYAAALKKQGELTRVLAADSWL